MPIGPGKYDDECTRLRESTEAQGVIVIVIGGKLGSGLSMQAGRHTTLMLPDILEHIAAEIRQSFKDGKKSEDMKR